MVFTHFRVPRDVSPGAMFDQGMGDIVTAGASRAILQS